MTDAKLLNAKGELRRQLEDDDERAERRAADEKHRTNAFLRTRFSITGNVRISFDMVTLLL